MTAQPTILLVDGFAKDRSLYCRYLKRGPRYDYRVVEFEAGRAALEFCQHSLPDLIVLSNQLPDMEGLEFIRVLKQQSSSFILPIVILLGQNDEALVVQAMREGVQDYLIKSQLTGEIFRRSIYIALEQGHLKRQIEYQREQQQLVSTIALRIRQSLHLTDVLQTAVAELRAFLQADWVVVYQCDAHRSCDQSCGLGCDQGDKVVAKSLAANTTDSDIPTGQKLQETCSQIRATFVNSCSLLDSIELDTNIVVPILIERPQASKPEYWGLLIAHRYRDRCTWSLVDRKLLSEIGVQLAIAIYQAELYQQAQTELTERRKAEVALRQAEAMHRIILDAVPDLIIRMKRDGTYLDFRSAKELPIVQPYSNMQGVNLRDIMPPHLVTERLHYVQQALDSGEMQVYNYQVQIKDQLIWQEARIVVSGEDEVLVIIRDISVQKQAEAAQQQAQAELEQQRALLRTVIDAVPDLIYVKDEEGRHILVNQAIADLYETTVEQLIGKTNFGFIDTPELFEQFQQQNQQLLKTQQALLIPEEMQRVKGEERWRRWYKRPLYMPQLHKHVVLAVGTDITDRKQAETALQQLNQELEDRVNARTLALQMTNEQLQEEVEIRRKTELLLRASQSRFQKLAANVPGVIYQFLRQPDGTETMPYISSGMQALCELDAEAAMQDMQLIWQLVHLEDVPKLKESTEVSATTLQPWQEEFRITTPSGQSKWIQGIARPEGLQDGSILWDGILIDITALKQIEDTLQQQVERERLVAAQLAQATDMKDEFLANMSHELRTPLNAILGMAEGLLDEICGPLADKQKKAINIIERSGKHLLELINDMLDLAKIEAGKLDLQITLVPIKRLCSTSLNLISPLVFKKNIELITEIPDEIGGLQVDERRMQQVLINLLSNAVKFTPDGGSVKLEVSVELLQEVPPEGSHNAQITFSIIDTGIGIDPKDINSLFQSFVQIDSSLNRQYSGTGLGLALVKRLVELHQGRVSVESKPGEGSCFMVHLPYHIDPTKLNSAVKMCCEQMGLEETDYATFPSSFTTRQPQRFEGQAQLGSPLILLTEDDEANIEAVSNHLINQGYRLIIARNGLEAVSLAKHRKPNLILMDIQMPIVNGLEAIYLIRTYHELISTPIIAMTALVMPGDREKCLAAGANDYLAKPINLKQLIDVMQQQLQLLKS